MSKVAHKKLVRDNIPLIIQEKGKVAEIRVLSDAEYKSELLKKIVEEAKEVQVAVDDESLKKEIADVLEVVEHIMKAFKLDPNDVAEIKKRKKHECGGFEKKIFLEFTE